MVLQVCASVMIRSLFESIKDHRFSKFHFLIDKGVGKTYAVRLATENDPGPTKLISLRGSELLANHATSEAALELQKTFQMAAQMTHDEANLIVIIFLDECDALLGVGSVAAMLAIILDKVSDSSSHLQAGGMDSWGRVLVVAATNRVDSIPSMLRRSGRLDQEIPMSPPNATERATILTKLIRDYQSDNEAVPDVGYIQQLADLTVGYVPADLTALVRKAMLLAIQTRDVLDFVHFEQAMEEVGASALRDAALSAPPKITWDDISGDPGGAKVRLPHMLGPKCWSKIKVIAHKYHHFCSRLHFVKLLSGQGQSARHISL